MYDTIFSAIDNILWKGCWIKQTNLIMEQTSWILFLKYLDDFQTEKEMSAMLSGCSYARIIDGEFRWTNWAAPKRGDGTLDYNSVLTGDDLLNFVNFKLFPHLASFKQTAENPHSLNL